MKTRKSNSISGLLILIAFYAAIITGEVKCIYKFFTSDFEPSYKREWVYGLSAISGFGCIVGYMDFPDTAPTASKK